MELTARGCHPKTLYNPWVLGPTIDGSLAVTSTNAMQGRLGPKWTKLHRLVYVIGVLGVVHFLWQVKIDATEPILYGIVLTLLLAHRAGSWLKRRQRLGATKALHRV
ncbi:MAG: hypothetical protein CM1200mP36_08720 [Gammaproteobacteria bacterium]|nr:MAG: hypothetical protein CM1200mP36_08720 [Gammaproteobacteria bacterium]